MRKFAFINREYILTNIRKFAFINGEHILTNVRKFASSSSEYSLYNIGNSHVATIKRPTFLLTSESPELIDTGTPNCHT